MITVQVSDWIDVHGVGIAIQQEVRDRVTAKNKNGQDVQGTFAERVIIVAKKQYKVKLVVVNSYAPYELAWYVNNVLEQFPLQFILNDLGWDEDGDNGL